MNHKDAERHKMAKEGKISSKIIDFKNNNNEKIENHFLLNNSINSLFIGEKLIIKTKENNGFGGSLCEQFVYSNLDRYMNNSDMNNSVVFIPSELEERLKKLI